MSDIKATVDECKDENNVFDLDLLIKKSNENITKVRIGGTEYVVKKMTRKVVAKFNELGAQMAKVEKMMKENPEAAFEDKLSPHELAAKQLNCLMDTPLDAFDEVDLSVVKEILDFVVSKVAIMGESQEKGSK